jgi:hypothetical protein
MALQPAVALVDTKIELNAIDTRIAPQTPDFTRVFLKKADRVPDLQPEL